MIGDNYLKTIVRYVYIYINHFIIANPIKNFFLLRGTALSDEIFVFKIKAV